MGHPLPCLGRSALNVESVSAVARPDASDVYDLQLRLRLSEASKPSNCRRSSSRSPDVQARSWRGCSP